MHIEFLIEDASGKRFLELILPNIIRRDDVTWNIHGYKGIGVLPKDLAGKTDPSKRIILDQLPRLLSGFGRTPYVDAVVVVVDTDKRDCNLFLGELKNLLNNLPAARNVMFRLAIEEMEAWYFGDEAAITKAYPNRNTSLIRNYVQDSICGTWERLADAIAAGGSSRLLAQGWPAPGILEYEWAEKITPFMSVDDNISPSFQKLRDGVRSLTE